MRLAILSDLHGNLPALEAVLAEVQRWGAETVVHLGDLLSGPLWPAATCDRLIALDALAIAGNHERQVLTLPRERMGASDAHAAAELTPRHRHWLAALPATRALGDGVWCCHGTPTSDLQYWLETVDPAAPGGVREATEAEAQARAVGRPADAQLLLCGHTHQPRLRLLPDGPLVLNPGSVGLPAFDDDHPTPHHMETGSPLARWATAERRDAGWQLTLQATPYDHEAAARQAERHHRPDWADALRRGRVGRTEAQALAAPRGDPRPLDPRDR